jgi:F-type H+-transporting ATPase subunit a
MKLLVLAITLLLSASAFAGGYTYLSGPAHMLHIGEQVLTYVLVSVLIILIGFYYRIKVMSAESLIIPDKGISFRNIIEAYGESMYGLAKNIMGEKEASEYFGVIAVTFLTVFISNTIGLIPGFLPPTDNLNTTLALGLFIFIYYNVQGVRVQGLVGHIKHFMGPILALAPLIFIIEIISHVVRPLSLGLRLRGNMFGDHLVLSIFSDLLPYIVPIVFYIIGLFVCFMQAFVFTLLSMVYIGLATERHDHGEEGHH